MIQLLFLFSHSVVCDSLWPHRLQHARPPRPSLSPGACSDSCPLSQWCHPIILSSVVPFSPAYSLSQHQDLLQWVTSLHHVAKVLALQLPHQSNSGLISFTIDWFDLLVVQGTLQHYSLKPSILQCSALLSSSHICTCLLEQSIVLTKCTFVGKV